mmetsp:Transcript_11467/g.24757  ORF Transcript_11467/g.24757 Transcript_11467/m.24757 type:complete len:173 (+) Transcript_11467:628-1146(+)
MHTVRCAEIGCKTSDAPRISASMNRELDAPEERDDEENAAENALRALLDVRCCGSLRMSTKFASSGGWRSTSASCLDTDRHGPEWPSSRLGVDRVDIPDENPYSRIKNALVSPLRVINTTYKTGPDHKRFIQDQATVTPDLCAVLKRITNKQQLLPPFVCFQPALFISRRTT